MQIEAEESAYLNSDTSALGSVFKVRGPFGEDCCCSLPARVWTRAQGCTAAATVTERVAAGRWSCSRAFQSNTVDTQPAEMPRFVPCVHVHIRQSWFAGQCGRAERLKTAVRASPRNLLLTLRVRIAGLRGRAEREGRAAAEGRQSRCEGRAPVQPVFGNLRCRAPLHL